MPAGRKPILATEEEIRRVLDMHAQEPVGVLRTVVNLKTDCDISYRRAYRIMKDNGPSDCVSCKVKEEKMGAL